jgi:predicted TIM-barrel fold metal-dependent hydrolase
MESSVMERLSPGARAFLERAIADLDGQPLADYHGHIMGIGTGGTGCEVHPDMLSWRHPLRRLKMLYFARVCGVRDLARMDAQYEERLVGLLRAFPVPVRFHSLGLDRFYRPKDGVDPDKMDFYTPNDYVAALAQRHPSLFVPVVSIHPYRADALAELEAWADRGVRFVKWLPNAQGMDPADSLCDPFYAVMKARGLALLTHTGKEKSVGSFSQELANPLRLRRPLEAGVRVIMAHCASTGQSDDIDRGSGRVRNFELFLRMMGDERYRGLLFGELSALMQVNRAPGPILELIRRPEWHDRLVNGSDYPLPAVNTLIWTRQFVLHRMITGEERAWLDEIRRVNPLLFDYALKRALRDPATGRRLPARVFLPNPGLPLDFCDLDSLDSRGPLRYSKRPNIKESAAEPSSAETS